MNKILGDRIKQARNKRKFTQQQLAIKLNIAYPTLNKYEKNHRVPDATILNRMAKILSCDPGWLLSGEDTGQCFDNKQNIPDDYILIPQVSGDISAGEGLAPNNNIETKIAFQKDWLKKKGDPSRMSLIRVSGDSMVETLYPGDIVLINHEKNYVSPEGGLYAITIDDGILIKRIQVQLPLKKLRIISDNKKYDTIENVNPNDIVINGKVIWYGRDLEK